MTALAVGEYFMSIVRTCAGPPVSSSTREALDVALLLEHAASASLSFDDGIETSSCIATLALRMRVSMSAMGSVMVIGSPPPYQLAFVTPGISPACASSRRQMRQSPNLR